MKKLGDGIADAMKTAVDGLKKEGKAEEEITFESMADWCGRHVLLTSPESIDKDGIDPPKGKIEPPERIDIEGFYDEA